MLKTISFRNYQTHRKLVLKLKPGLNVLIGDNDVGKSAAIRGVKWAVFNRPRGLQHLRWGSSEMSVEMKYDNGDKVKRIRDKTINEYRLNDEVYKVPSTGIPAAVEKVLNLTPINFQFQHDRAFMLSETAGEVGKQINEMVDLTIIDTTLSCLNKQARENSQERESLSLTIKRRSEELDGFKNMDEMEEALGEMTRTEAQKNNLFGTCAKIERQVAKIKTGKKAIKELECIDDMEKDLKACKEARKEFKRAERESEKLEEDLERIRKTRKTSAVTLPIKQLGRIVVLKRERKLLRKQGITLRDLLKDIEQEQKYVNSENVSILEAKLKKAIGKECPLCRRPMP